MEKIEVIFPAYAQERVEKTLPCFSLFLEENLLLFER